MKKELKTKYGKHFLIGVDNDGVKHYLKEASWDCGWYWGFGYMHTFKANDIGCHYHFDSFSKETNLFDGVKNSFVECVLNDCELWKLCELMKTFYTLKQTAEVLGRGGSHYTTNPCKDIIINLEEVERINKKVLPEIFKEIYKLLTPQ